MVFSLGHRSIGAGCPPFVIAEMSGNHNQSLDNALSIVESAAAAGAHAIKLQTYTADTLTLNHRTDDFLINSPDSPWFGKNLHDLYATAYTPWEWHKPIMDRAQQLGMICFSSPFDETAVDFLEDLDVPAYKIASFENNHLPLISKAASTGKPLIISTGLASLSDLEKAVDTARSAGCNDLVLLKCTSTYPASPSNTNIATIPHLRSLFSCDVGLSDHTLGVGVSVASVALGASIIEKHFTLSRDAGGVDSSFSMEPSEFQQLVDEVYNAWLSLGSITYGATEAETSSSIFRRSIFVSSDIQPGDTFSTSNIRIVRPGTGAPPYFYDILIGKTSKSHFKAGTPLNISDLI